MTNHAEQETTNTLELTQHEIDLILAYRAENERRRKAHEFRKSIVKVTYDWLEWSEKEGVELTISTFVNGFKFDGKGTAVYYYQAIKHILECVREYEPPEEQL